MHYDIVIIGAGPAGASAGIFAARAKKNVLILDEDNSGTKKAWIDNHYAVMGMTGYDVFETGKKQAEKFGAKLLTTKVLNLVPVADDCSEQDKAAQEGTAGRFRLTTEDGVFDASIVMMASGSSKELAKSLDMKMKKGSEPGTGMVIDVDAEGRTSIPGIWAAGLCTGSSMHVAVTAGDGARTAIHILSEMNGKRHVDHDMMC
ncbi:FAD-dependent oxidoreductase [Marinicrinis sediminis]|uniref:FAD-dependent oxidoreductase n=1 Tax=Marinicrinis sediminis TaxID=1652465 RepID=A0ABW5RGY3_9BACL